MIATSTRDFHLFQQTLLEWPKNDLDRAYGLRILRACEPQPLSELGWVVGDEITAFPVALERGGDLRNSICVSNSRKPKVPFEASDLRRVR